MVRARCPRGSVSVAASPPSVHGRFITLQQPAQSAKDPMSDRRLTSMGWRSVASNALIFVAGCGIFGTTTLTAILRVRPTNLWRSGSES